MNRLRAFRDIEGINQDELGGVLGLSLQMVSAIESGRRTFSGGLAPLGYRDDRFTLPSMSEPLHRHRASTGVAAKKKAKELIRLAGEVFGELVSRTPNAPIWTLDRRSSPMSHQELENLTIEVRGLLEHEESGPIRNLTAAVERAGVCLIPITNVTGIDGLSSWVNNVPVIGLSPNMPGDRFRFTLSHELGHLLMHHRIAEYVEKEANQFAGALLFPREDFDAAMPERPQLRDFIALKSSWGIAVSALVYRAHELGYLDDRRYRALQIQMSKWHKNEPMTFPPVYGSLLARLIDVNGGTSDVAHDLGFNKSHLAELTDWRYLRAA